MGMCKREIDDMKLETSKELGSTNDSQIERRFTEFENPCTSAHCQLAALLVSSFYSGHFEPSGYYFCRRTFSRGAR
ncbi:hypothetical protein RRG08_065077 [Elysia crispata]|uniref:Uncharacterized protein n=1 Tax=Elysia crispata TaxID=231223 RepID=A0AAE0ZMV6_9GAST|nr:hypothetical protein RRG08_065077 [Elysia crispata]